MRNPDARGAPVRAIQRQQRNLQREREFAMQLPITRNAPDTSDFRGMAAGGVAARYAFWTVAGSLPKGRNVSRVLGRFTRALGQQKVHQSTRAASRPRSLSVRRRGGSGTRLASVQRLLLRLPRTPSSGAGRRMRSPLLRAVRVSAWCRPLPERLARPLLTVTEERPTDASLVVLGAGESERQEGDASLVREVLFGGQFVRPEWVVDEVKAGNARVEIAIEQAGQTC